MLKKGTLNGKGLMLNGKRLMFRQYLPFALTHFPFRPTLFQRPAIGVVALMLLALDTSSACRRSPDASQKTTAERGGELVASLRSEPHNYSRYFEPSTPADLMSMLVHARLVRVNRATDALEPALAESWEASADGLTHTLRLRNGVMFSDGAPFTAADVLFSFAVAYDAPGSVLADSLLPGGKRLEVASPDPSTVTIRFPEPFAPGVRILDHLPILPRH
jgi:ABC-type transport system substrate-binding protein